MVVSTSCNVEKSSVKAMKVVVPPDDQVFDLTRFLNKAVKKEACECREVVPHFEVNQRLPKVIVVSIEKIASDMSLRQDLEVLFTNKQVRVGKSNVYKLSLIINYHSSDSDQVLPDLREVVETQITFKCGSSKQLKKAKKGKEPKEIKTGVSGHYTNYVFKNNRCYFVNDDDYFPVDTVKLDDARAFVFERI